MKLLVISLIMMISGCGMQGDLYLPDETSKKENPKKDSPGKESSKKEN